VDTRKERKKEEEEEKAKILGQYCHAKDRKSSVTMTINHKR